MLFYNNSGVYGNDMYIEHTEFNSSIASSSLSSYEGRVSYTNEHTNYDALLPTHTISSFFILHPTLILRIELVSGATTRQ